MKEVQREKQIETSKKKDSNVSHNTHVSKTYIILLDENSCSYFSP